MSMTHAYCVGTTMTASCECSRGLISNFGYWMASAQRRFQPLGSGFKTHRLATCHAVTPRRIESGLGLAAGCCWPLLAGPVPVPVPVPEA